MKKPNKKSKTKLINELTDYFVDELDKQLEVAVLPNGTTVYKDYVIKRIKNGNWAIYSLNTKDLVDQFFLKTCALMAAKAYNSINLTKYHQIKHLDNHYWANFQDNMIYKKNIKTAKDFERFAILLNKLEDTEQKTQYYKGEISKMFKWSFV